MGIEESDQKGMRVLFENSDINPFNYESYPPSIL